LLSIITLDEKDKWDSIVKSFENYDVYYLSGYVTGFKLHGDGEPILFYYENNEFRAINVVIKRLIENTPKVKNNNEKAYYDLTTPYGYGGFIFEGIINDKEVNLLNNVYTDYCYKNNIISEFVRFHPVLRNSENSDYIYNVIDLGRTITINLKSEEQIWRDLRSKNRNVIRKAKNSDVKIYSGRSPYLVDQFIPLYNSTMDSENARDYYYFNKDFYSSIINDLKYNSLFFYALYRNKIISMSIILFSNKKMHYHLSASDMEFRNLASTNLLLYEAACWGCENGYKSFHLGGGLSNSEDDGLFRFKKAFNEKSETSFSIGTKIFNKKIYDKLVDIRKKASEFDIDDPFFPKYRQ